MEYGQSGGYDEPPNPITNTFSPFAIGCTSTPSNGDADISDASVQDALAADGGDAAIPECSSDEECNDRSSCTGDRCENGLCITSVFPLKSR